MSTHAQADAFTAPCQVSLDVLYCFFGQRNCHSVSHCAVTRVIAPPLPCLHPVSFTPGASFGVHVLGVRNNVSFSIRYGHISNAGLSRNNPGINTVQFTVGIGRFSNGHGARKKP